MSSPNETNDRPKGSPISLDRMYAGGRHGFAETLAALGEDSTDAPC